MRELGREGRQEDMEDSYTVHTGLWDSQQGEEMGEWAVDFCTKKKSLHTAGLLHSSVRVWNNMCEEHLNNPISFS